MTSNDKAAAVLFALMTNCYNCSGKLETDFLVPREDVVHVCNNCGIFYYLSIAHRRRIYPSATSDHPDHVVYMNND